MTEQSQKQKFFEFRSESQGHFCCEIKEKITKVLTRGLFVTFSFTQIYQYAISQIRCSQQKTPEVNISPIQISHF